MAIAWAIGAGVGLAALAGFRSFIPLAVFMLFARLGWAWGFNPGGGDFDFMLSGWAVMGLVVLLVLEILLTRVQSVTRLDSAMRPALAVIIGGLLAATCVSADMTSPAHFAFLAAGAVLGLLGLYVHNGLRMAGEGADPGPALDAAVIVLSALVMLVPPAGYVLLILLLWMGWRVRKLRRLKYKGLRVLA